MNREIEFRAWDGKRMTTSGIMFNCSNGLLETPIGANMKLMQFTGLTDKNGVKIFEGDLLNIGSDVFGFVTNMNNELVTYEVKHETTDFILYRHDIKLKWGRLSRLEEMLWNCQIIGNIYENKNLIL